MPETIIDTPEIRFGRAVDKARESIFVHPQYSSCCSSCGADELYNLHADAPYAFVFSGQTRDYVWEDGWPYFIEEGDEGRSPFMMAKEIYWGFNDISAAETIEEVFESEGFAVDWDGTDRTKVSVIINWDEWKPASRR